MPDGVTTSYLTPAKSVTELLGNSEGGTVRIAIELVAAIIAQSIPGPNLTTQAELLADLDWDEPTLGAVWGDANDALNGVYKKSGAAGDGSWTRIGGLPMSAATLAALAAKAPLASPALTGIPTAPTAPPGTNSAQLATTAFIQTAVAALVEAAPGTLDTLNELAAALGDDPNFATTMANSLALKAPLDGPSFLGVPKSPTAAPGTDTNQIASTSFVQAAISALSDLVDLKAPISSPALTGIPTAPTAPPGTNSAQLATTAFIQTAVAALIESAPGTLDTLNELASALNDDPDFAATMTTALATKAPLEAPSFTGDVHVSGQIVTEDDFEADARPVAGGIASEDGAGLMSVSDDGTLVAAGLDLVGCDPVFELEADALPGAETVVSDAEQPVVALGGAGLDLLLSSYSLSRLLDQMSAGAALRCGVMARGVTTGHALRRGSVCDRDGYTLRVAERVYGAGDAAVIQGSSPMEFFPGLGQSNVMWGGVANGGNNPRKLIGPVYPYSVFGFQQTGAVGAASPIFATTSAATEVDPADLGDFLPYHDWISQPAHPQGAHVMAATAVEMAERAAGRAGPGVVAHADWNGGEPIQTFVEGGAPFENVIHHAVRAQQIAALYSRDMVCRAVLFTQGESGGTTYEDALDGIVTALRARVQAALSQPSAPAVLIHQTNDSDTAASNSLYCLNQLAVYESRPSEAPIVGPMYQSRLTDSGIHGDAESRMMLGEVVGEVYRRLKDGEPWYPVMIHSASRSGAVITLKYTASDTTYRLPGDDLEFDPGPGQPGDGWVEPIVDYGFYYTDDSSGASISSVSIVKDPNGRATRVQITLDGDPGAATGKKIRYALCDAGDVAADGWSSGRGQLRSRGRRSSFRDLGHAVPEFIYFYAVRQEIDL